MSRQADSGEYYEFTSLSLGEDAVAAADRSRVALCSADGHIEVFGVDRQTSLTFASSIEDISVGKYLFILSENTVTAYTTSSIEFWTTTVETCKNVATLGKGGIVTCVTEDGRLVGLDAETGNQLFETEREHGDISEINAVEGGFGYVMVAAWSFLTAYDKTGTVIFDENLDGAIEDATVLDGAVIVRLKDGRLLCIDIPDGDIRWRQTDETNVLASVGNLRALTAGDDGLVVLDEYGNKTPMDVPAGKSIVATLDGQVIAVGTDGSYSVYRMGPTPHEQLSATILTDAIRPDQSIRVRVSNRSDDSVTATIELDSNSPSVEFVSDEITIDCDSQEAVEEGFRVANVTEETDVQIEVKADGHSIGSKSVAVEREGDLEESISWESEVERIAGNRATIALRVANQGEKAIKAGIGEATTDIAPGERQRLTDVRECDNGDDTLLTLVAERGDQRVSSTVSVSIPAHQPSLSLVTAGTLEQPYLDVIVSNDADVAVFDSVHLSRASEVPPLERDVSLEPGTEVRIVVPLLKQHVEQGITATATLTESEQEVTKSFIASDWVESMQSGDEQTAAASPPQSADQSSENSLAPESTDVATRSGTHSLAVTRQLPNIVTWGRRFAERIEVRNDGDKPANNVSLTVGNGSITFEQVDPGETVAAVRSHALFDIGEVELADGTVAVNGDPISVESRTVVVNQPQFGVRATLTAEETDPQVAFECHNNHSSKPCQIQKIGARFSDDEPAVETLNPAPTLSPGDSSRITQGLVVPESFSKPVVRASVQYAFPETGSQTGSTLVDVESFVDQTDRTTSADGRSDTDLVDVAVHDQSIAVAGRSSAIQLSIHNTSKRSVANLSLEAEGDALNALSRGERRFDSLDPDETALHPLDIEAEDIEVASFVISVSGLPDMSSARQYEVSGPVAASEEQWYEENMIAEWTVEPLTRETEEKTGDTSNETAGGAKPEHIVTAFRQASPGNLR